MYFVLTKYSLSFKIYTIERIREDNVLGVATLQIERIIAIRQKDSYILLNFVRNGQLHNRRN